MYVNIYNMFNENNNTIWVLWNSSLFNEFVFLRSKSSRYILTVFNSFPYVNIKNNYTFE